MQLRNLPAAQVADPEWKAELWRLPERGAKLDLMCDLEEEGDGFFYHCEYATDLFDPPTVERLMARVGRSDGKEERADA